MKIGILGTSDISIKAIIPYASNELIIDAVASRNYKKANLFAANYKILKVYNNYLDLLEDDEIDSVYIALPPALHCKWVCKALKNKKNILVEKPMCLNIEEFNKISQLVKKNFVLEALMIQHHPWMKKVKEILDKGNYGKILKCITKITMKIPPEMEDGFRSNATLGGGVVIDEAPYWICIMQNIFNGELKILDSKILDKKNNSIWKSEITGTIDSYVKVQFYCSYNDTYSSDLIIEMDSAILEVKNFFRASMGDYKIKFLIKESGRTDTVTFLGQNYYRNQINYFNKYIHNTEICEQNMKQSKERVFLLEQILKKLN